MAIAMRGLRVRPQYEDLIGVAKSNGLGNIEFPNRDATFLREGFILHQLDGEGTRQMQLQQEQASRHAFGNSFLNKLLLILVLIYRICKMILVQIIEKTGLTEYSTTPPMKPQEFDMTRMDDTPFETPHYENPIASDLSHRINRRLGFEEQEELYLINKHEQQIENTKKETVQHLEELQPKRRHADVDTKALTRKYLDRVYEAASMKEQAREYINKEFKQYEKKQWN